MTENELKEIEDTWRHFVWRNSTEQKMLQAIGALMEYVEDLRKETK
ncbi:MAG: hypothetical protein ACQEXB_24495 [Bacillota bacterium]